MLTALVGVREKYLGMFAEFKRRYFATSVQ